MGLSNATRPPPASLVKQLYGYGAWRAEVAARIAAYGRWLRDNDLNEAPTESRVAQLLARLAEDKLTIAFVAEFSRGKSELINAIFFADHGRRLLPSSTGRTTMCPTEISWDPSRAPSIRLLPIETRATQATTSEFRQFPEEWHVVPLDVKDPLSLVEAFQQVRDTRRVPIEEAKHYGMFLQDGASMPAGADGMVEIPRWRHAIVNLPHPLLERGLVILDTPGLNAIGVEPELTLGLLPNAHAVLFVLAVDTGVTKTDAEVWKDYLAPVPGSEAGRYVVLNKIDTLWDGLRTDREIDHEIENQTEFVADVLRIPSEQVLAVSAQKGLVAKITEDRPLLMRSRLPDLEYTLANQIIPSKQSIVRETTRREFANLVANTRAVLSARLAGLSQQLAELRSLRGKNRNVVAEMIRRVGAEKEEFERGLARFQATRSVFAQLTNTLFTHLGMDALAEQSRQTLKEMNESRFSLSLRAAMAGYFRGVRARMIQADAVIGEIHAMMCAMYRRFGEEHGLRLGEPQAFSLARFDNEFHRLQRNFRTQFDTVGTMLTHEKMTLIRNFFATLASQMSRLYHYANKDVESWLRAIMAPMEAQIRERQVQVRRRVESIKRIHQATESLEDRIVELEHAETALLQQLDALHDLSREIDRVLDLESPGDGAGRGARYAA